MRLSLNMLFNYISVCKLFKDSVGLILVYVWFEATIVFRVVREVGGVR